MKKRYRIKHVIRKGRTCYIPQIRRFFMWFDAMGEGMMGMYYITFSNHDDAVNWIKADIEHYKKLADNRTIEHIPFFTRSERIQKLNK